MKKILLPLAAALFALASCNEELVMNEFIEKAPVITSFEPISGPPGTVITIRGENLNRVDTVYVGDVEAVIVSKTNDKLIQMSIPATGSTGKVTVKNLIGSSTSQDVFTYEYPTPTISTYPESGDVASLVVFFGTNMASITGVTFNGEEASIVSSKLDELVVRIPDMATGNASVVFTYQTDASTTGTINGTQAVEVTKTAPIVNVAEIPTSVVPGDRVTVTGESLEKIDSVCLGGARVSITRITPDGRSMDLLFTDDKYEFTGGENTRDLIAYGLYGTPFPFVANMKITVPKVLVTRDYRIEVGQNAGNTGQFFYNLEEGQAVNGQTWRVIDNVSYSRMNSGGAFSPDKGPMSGVNKLVRAPEYPSGVSKAEYYSVPPYFMMMYVSSSFPFIMPGGVATLIRSINAGTGVNNAAAEKTIPNTGTTLFGTPVLLYRTLNPNAPAEKAIIDKVHDGTIADEIITKEIIRDWDFTTAQGPGDSYSNQLCYSNAHLPHGGKAAGTSRPCMGQFAASQILALPASGPAPEVEIKTPEPVGGIYQEGSNVIVMIYFDYNYTGATPGAMEYDNIRKIGFIEITKLNNGGPYDASKGSAWNGRVVQNAYIYVNAYWQRTPEGGWGWPD